MLEDQEDNRPPKKILFAALAAMMFAIVGSAGIMMYLGVFTSVDIEKKVTPKYRMAYLDNIGPYNEIGAKIKQVARTLEEANIKSNLASALFLDDSSVVAREELRSKVGYLVAASDYLPGSLMEEEIPSREVISAKFDGSPVIGSYKAYEAMKKWSSIYGYNLSLPALEIYLEDGTVEYQLPITKK